LWWLDFYTGFRQHLDDHYGVLLRSDDCVLYTFKEGEGMKEVLADERGAGLYPEEAS
jgi:hypothetical protein